MTGMYQSMDIVSQVTINLGTRSPRTFVWGRIVSGRPVNLPFPEVVGKLIYPLTTVSKLQQKKVEASHMELSTRHRVLLWRLCVLYALLLLSKVQIHHVSEDENKKRKGPK